MDQRTKYKRVLIKVSGEALAGDNSTGIDPLFLNKVAKEIISLANKNIQIAIVVGGGNIFRGISVAAKGGDRVTGDNMGMLATVINAIALADAIKQNGAKAHVFSSISMPKIADDFTQRDGLKAIQNGEIVICAAGTGNPFFTTDTAAALKAIELGCDILLKGTNVDGIYSEDPKQNPNAKRYDSLTFDEAINKNLKIMDMAAFSLARENNLPILVYSIKQQEALIGVLEGKVKSTYVG